MLIEAISRQVFRRAAPLAIRHLARPDLNTREPLARRVLDQAAHEFQMVPPITIHSADPELMAGLWCATREAYVVGAKGRAMREAVAAAVSRLNACPYCITVHSGMFAAAGGEADTLNEPMRLPAAIEPAATWAAATLSPDSREFQEPRLPAADIPQVFGTAVVYHYINRLVSVFLEETPVALPAATRGVGKRLVDNAFSILGKRIVARDPVPGRCVAERESELPEAFARARANSAVATALAHFAWAAERAGQEAVEDRVRVMVEEHLAGWRGEQAPLSRAWVEEFVGPLDEALRLTARLALLSARAAYQVDDRLIGDFRKTRPGDKPLLQTVAWASFAAARRIAEWFPANAASGDGSKEPLMPVDARANATDAME